MDPVACLADFLTADSDSQRTDAAEAWRTWLNKGGFKPLVVHVRAEVENRGYRWTKHRHAIAVLAGAV